MFGLRSKNWPSAPYPPREFTVKKAMLLLIKQIAFLFVVGLVIWAAHTVVYSPANACNTPSPLTKIDKSEDAVTKSPAIKDHNLNTRNKP